MRTIYTDQQTRVDAQGVSSYMAMRAKILSPEALHLGNFWSVWNPESDEFTVHYFRIVRDGRTIDVYPANSFKIIQRESNLENAMLDGRLTATLQAPGVQIGDEIELAATLRHRDPTLRDASSGLMQLPVTGALGAYRVRLLWPKSRTVQWAASPDLAAIAPAESKDQWEIVQELRDPDSVVTAEGAPSRFNKRRQIQFSSFRSWSEVSEVVWPLFEQASTLAPDSPIRAEASKIAAETTDPAARAEAALRLVQERIRYVYVGLDGGNYRPATADETWSRRFGDCKAKTVVLMALLRELRVPHEPVLVRLAGDDGTDKSLPALSAFDHVLVRARIGGRPYWLDGVRFGDRSLAGLPEPTFRWALPLGSASAELEQVEAKGPALPLEVSYYEQDSRAGFDQPAKMRLVRVYRGDAVQPIRTRLASLRPQDAQTLLKGLWRNDYDWIEAEEVAWSFNETTRALVLELKGEGKPPWRGDDVRGREINIAGAGFTPPNKLRRPAEQDQTAPWSVAFPSYKCWASVIKLPAATAKWRWDYIADPVDRDLGGVSYWRRTGLDGGVMRRVMSRRAFVPEISAAQAQQLNDGVAGFNNRISQLYQTRGPISTKNRTAGPGPGMLERIDWSGNELPCARPQASAAD